MDFERHIDDNIRDEPVGHCENRLSTSMGTTRDNSSLHYHTQMETLSANCGHSAHKREFELLELVLKRESIYYISIYLCCYEVDKV